MVSAQFLQLLAFVCLTSVLAFKIDDKKTVLVVPESPWVEIGTNFTAICLINSSEINADNVKWKMETEMRKAQYTRINDSATSVTFTVTGEKAEWLTCLPERDNLYSHRHGILISKAYPPSKPENLTCIANQIIEREFVVNCTWETRGPQTKESNQTYTLHSSPGPPDKHRWVTTKTNTNSAYLHYNTYPYYTPMNFWVVSQNKLGSVQSKTLTDEADYFVKTIPPIDVTAKSEKTLPNSFYIQWQNPLGSVLKKVQYQIKFCQRGSSNWSYVPEDDIGIDISSFRLQDLQADTVYDIQMRCKIEMSDGGFWSNWSTNATSRTPETQPTDKPDLWMDFVSQNVSARWIQFRWKDPVKANGRITNFLIKYQYQRRGNVVSETSQNISVNRSETDSFFGRTSTIALTNGHSVKMEVIAQNSVGSSPPAFLAIPDRRFEKGPVEELKVQAKDGRFWVEWKPLKNTTEYVVQWATTTSMNWQREHKNTNRTVIRDVLSGTLCYNITVYPIYSGWLGKPTTMQAYLELNEPGNAPDVRVDNRCPDEANLTWDHIPQNMLKGFVTNYTIFYKNGQHNQNVTVPANATSLILKPLMAGTTYIVRIRAHSSKGYTDGREHTFTTEKYCEREIELIVVGVCLTFFFVVLLTMLLCFYKREALKRNFWPPIPDPGESTIGNWSPDYPLKAETPKDKENGLSGISVLDVEACDGKSVYEEDKAGLPLKKDKYLSEEHSSGIGGSSCMSSPRQSMSDSDEGGDLADTTASTVQYSSVVAPGAYKGQTPSSQPQQVVFSRSESTQPLLESEDHPDTLAHEGGRQFQRFRKPCFTGSQDSSGAADFAHLEMEPHDALEPLDFCPLEEDAETASDSQSASASSYMPQLGGYRPQ